MLRRAFLLAALALGSAACAQTPQPDAFTRIAATHKLLCGIDQSEAEYTLEEEHGPRMAFDQQLCRAVAVAIAGRGAQVEYKAYPDDETALTALRTGEVDLVPTVSVTTSRLADLSLGFTRTVFYDGVGLLTRTSEHAGSAKDLAGKKICFLAETETETVLHAEFEARHLDLLAFPFQEEGEMEAAYISHDCRAIASERTRLASIRASFGDQASEHVLLSDHFDDDAMAMAFRSADARLGRLANETIAVLLAAEEISAEGENAGSERVRRISGKSHELGNAFHLRDDWAVDVLSAVGSYGQLYDRTLGKSSPLALPRDENRLCSQGGVLCASTLR